MKDSKQYGLSSSQIAKNRLLALQSEAKQQYINQTNGIISNTTPIDNNLLWENDHNIMCSKGD